MLYIITKSGNRIPFYNTEQYRNGLKTRIEKLKEKAKKEIGEEELEYKIERQEKLWLAHDEPTENNPFPAFTQQNINRVIKNIRTSANPKNDQPKISECD